ncbi:MAG: DUF2723 domain-containing protein [Chloroflexi bacterium]|nr:DUF2723 domain-containing protein [Chloroflexota bacterium]
MTFANRFFQNRWLMVIVVFIGLLAIYIRTLLPGTVGGDAGEMQYAGPILALTHPTGHPLYVLMGYVWSKIIPIGTVAWRMNLLAAVSGAFSCAIVTAFVYRLHESRLVAVIAGLTLGLGATFWQQAVIADKYAFNTIFVAIVVGLALWWAAEREKPNGDKLLYVLSLAYGISFLHHRTMLLFAFGLAPLVLFYERQAVVKNWRRTLICIGLVLLPPLLVYPIFLPVMQARHLAPSEWQPNTVSEWMDWMMDRHTAKNAFVLEGFLDELGKYGRFLLDDYPFPILITALLGLLMMIRRLPGGALFLGISFALQALLSANYRDNVRPFTYYPPSFIIMIYAYAYGLKAILGWVEQKIGQGQSASGLGFRRLLPQFIMGGIALILIPVWQLWDAYPERREEAIYGKPLDLWRDTLKVGDMGDRLASEMENLPPNAVVLSDWEQVTILWYYQKVEDVRPDLELVYPVQKLSQYADTDRNICVARHIPVDETWHPTNVGALVCLGREPNFAMPADITPLGTQFFTPDGQPQLALVGYKVEDTVYEAGQFAPIILTWQALADLDTDYSISLHILTQDWQTVWSQDIQSPVIGMYATSRWVKDEVVQDYHEFDIPRDMPPTRYIWAVTVYRKLPDGGFEQLRDAQGGTVIYGGTFEVRPQ